MSSPADSLLNSLVSGVHLLVAESVESLNESEKLISLGFLLEH